jgi:hypothetical protein
MGMRYLSACPFLEIVTIGDELLLGFTIDTNAAHRARAAGLGIGIAGGQRSATTPPASPRPFAGPSIEPAP